MTAIREAVSNFAISANWDNFVKDHITRSWTLTLWLIILVAVSVSVILGRLGAAPATTAIVLVLWIGTVVATVVAEATHRHNRYTRWANRNLYNSITNIFVSLLVVLGIIAGLQGFFRYAVTTSSFSDIPPALLRGELVSSGNDVCFNMARENAEFRTLILGGEERCYAASTYAPALSATPLAEIDQGGAQFCFDKIPDDPQNGITCFTNSVPEVPTFYEAVETYSGANWGAVAANMRIMMVFRFDVTEMWRIYAMLIMIVVLAILSYFVYRDSFVNQPVAGSDATTVVPSRARIRMLLTFLWLLTPIMVYVFLVGVSPPDYPIDEGAGTIARGFFSEVFGWTELYETIEDGTEVEFLGAPAIIGEDVSAFSYADNQFTNSEQTLEELKIPWNYIRLGTIVFLLALAGTAILNRRYPAREREQDLVILGRSVLRIILGLTAILALFFAINVVFLILGSFSLGVDPAVAGEAGTTSKAMFSKIDPDIKWGGLLLTVLITIFAIVFSFPLGIVLALGRRSTIRGIPAWVTYPIAIGATIYLFSTGFSVNQELARNDLERVLAFWPLLIPVLAYAFNRLFKGNVVAAFSTLFIEFVRGIPFIAVLFLSIILFPLLIPKDVPSIAGTWRVMVGGALFAAAYLAENVRGGLQSIPNGQYEAADSLGLSTFNKYRLIIMPQALRVVIPAIVGQFIGLFKDTTLVAIVGLFDVLGVANAIAAQADWLGVRDEAYIFLFLLYFVGSSVMSIYSRRLEKSYGLGER